MFSSASMEQSRKACAVVHWITVKSRKGTSLKSPDRVCICTAAGQPVAKKGPDGFEVC